MAYCQRKFGFVFPILPRGQGEGHPETHEKGAPRDHALRGRCFAVASSQLTVLRGGSWKRSSAALLTAYCPRESGSFPRRPRPVFGCKCFVGNGLSPEKNWLPFRHFCVGPRGGSPRNTRNTRKRKAQRARIHAIPTSYARWFFVPYIPWFPFPRASPSMHRCWRETPCPDPSLHPDCQRGGRNMPPF